MRIYLTLLILIPLTLFTVGCSPASFATSSNELASSSTPAPDSTSQTQQTSLTQVYYPLYTKMLNYPFQGQQSEIRMQISADETACQLRSVESLIQDSTCSELPEFCDDKILKTFSQDDVTCAQALQAHKILSDRGGKSCPSQTVALSAQEVEEIRDPQVYIIHSEPALPSPSSISLSASCECTYNFEFPTVTTHLPALKPHCQTHFPEIYQ